MKLVSIDGFRDRLAREGAVALCGAGVSIPPPSDLPGGNDLRDLVIGNVLRDTENAPLVDRLLGNRAYQALLPEAALQEVGYFSQRAVEHFVAGLLRKIPPNHLHAAISRRFPEVYTTNFDHCFEDAGCAQVVHLHGSVDQPETLQTRLWRLGKTAAPQLERFKAAAESRAIFVTGYSLRDSDILNVLRASRSLKLLYLSHTPEYPAILSSLAGDVVCAIGSLDELWTLSTPAPMVRPRVPRGVRQPATANKALALLFLFETCGMVEEVQAIWELYNERLRGRALLRSTAILAETWRSAQRFAEAKTLCENLLKRPASRTPRNLDLISWALTVLALCEHEGGDDAISARRHLLESLAAINRYGRAREAPVERDRVAVWRAKIANNLGNVERDLGRYRRAEALYRFSISVKRSYGEEAAVAQTLSNMAVLEIARGRIPHAMSHLDDVIEILSKAPEAYVCKSAIFDVAAGMADGRGWPAEHIQFEAVDLDALDGLLRAEPATDPMSLDLLGRLRRLDDIRKGIE